MDHYSAEEIYSAQQIVPLKKRGRPKKNTTTPPAPQIASHLMVSPDVNQTLSLYFYRFNMFQYGILTLHTKARPQTWE